MLKNGEVADYPDTRPGSLRRERSWAARRFHWVKSKIDPYLRPLYDACCIRSWARRATYTMRERADRVWRPRYAAGQKHSTIAYNSGMSAEHHAGADEDVPDENRIRFKVIVTETRRRRICRPELYPVWIPAVRVSKRTMTSALLLNSTWCKPLVRENSTA